MCLAQSQVHLQRRLRPLLSPPPPRLLPPSPTRSVVQLVDRPQPSKLVHLAAATARPLLPSPSLTHPTGRTRV